MRFLELRLLFRNPGPLRVPVLLHDFFLGHVSTMSLANVGALLQQPQMLDTQPYFLCVIA